jgi:DNA-binding LytR/AlgR family response regulator
MNGMEAARNIRICDKEAVIIFVTNMAQYAIQGYEVNALDFILKPVTYENFVFRMEKALRYVAKKGTATITLKSQKGIIRIAVDEIYYVEVMLHYLTYHTARGEFTVRGTIKEAVRQLSDFSFAQCKNCYLVNLKYVESIEGSLLQVKGEHLQISRNCKNEFMQAFTRYVGRIGT